MFTKIVILTATLQLATASYAPPIERDFRIFQVDSTAPVDEAKALLAELVEKTNASLQEATTLLNSYEARINETATTVKKTGLSLIHQLSTDAIYQLNNITSNAGKVNADIDLCLKKAPLLKNLEKNVTTSFNVCVNKRSNSTKDILKDTKNAVRLVSLKVNDLEEEVGECGNDAKCLTAAIEDLKNAIISVPGTINDLAQGGAESVEHGGKLTANCVTLAQYNVVDESKAILKEILNCSADILAFFKKYVITNKVQLRVL